MKKCELCQHVAKIHCESDQASLCWECDTSVHTANFIVEKHLRTLLCNICQALTLWISSGPNLAPTLSLCQGCVNNTTNGHHSDRDSDDNDEGDNEDDENEDEDEDDEDEDDKDRDIQVVPLLSSFSCVSSPSSSSSNELSLSPTQKRYII